MSSGRVRFINAPSIAKNLSSKCYTGVFSMFGRRLNLLLLVAMGVVLPLEVSDAASPRQTTLLGPILDNSIAFGGGPGAGLNSSAASGTNGVLLNFDTDVTGGASDQVAFEWESFDTDLTGYDTFSLNINPTPGFSVGGAQVFIRSEDPLNPGTVDFDGGNFTGLTAGTNNRVSVNLSGVQWPDNVTGFGIQMFTNGFSIPGASAVVSTVADFTVTEDVLFDFNEGDEGWTTGFHEPSGHTHSLVSNGAADGTQALQIVRDRDATPGSFVWGSQRRFDADPDGEGGNPPDPVVLAQIADLENRINAADAIAFDITIKDPFPASPGFAGFHLEISDMNSFYQIQPNGQFFDATPDGGVQTNTFQAPLSSFIGQNGTGAGLPITDLGFQAEGFARFTIASNTDGDGIYELDNFRLIDQEVVTSADFDVDSDVDAADLAMWQAAYGVNNDGDADFDGDTDGRDLLIWQRQFIGAGGPLSAVSVPEPTSLVMLMMACACFGSRRK
jgi:hypothetical protein